MTGNEARLAAGKRFRALCFGRWNPRVRQGDMRLGAGHLSLGARIAPVYKTLTYGRMTSKYKPTLQQVFGISLLGLTTILALLFLIVFRGSRTVIEESSERIRETAGREIGDRVTRILAQPPAIALQFQYQMAHGLLDPRDPRAIEPALAALLLSNRNLGEVTLTSGNKIGFEENADMDIRLAESPREQWSVFRVEGAKSGEQIWSRHVHQDQGQFVADRRELAPALNFAALPVTREPGGALKDPTSDYTFVTPASGRFYGSLLPSDLHWSSTDTATPEAERVEVSVQQVITDSAGAFLGVLRVGVLTAQLDDAMKLHLAAAGQSDPHKIFLCDNQGRLITRIMPGEHIEEVGDDLRVAPAGLPREIATALADPKLQALGRNDPPAWGRFRSGSEEYLSTFLPLTGTQDWIVGIVVPESYYLGRLAAMRKRLLVVSLGMILLAIGGGIFILRGVKRAQAQIAKESLKMNAFDFSPAATDSAFRDVSEVLESLEKAKTAMRAMGKYAPIDLVRRLYRENSEPSLGGQPMEISIMFTDIKGFTTFSEQLSANDLADALGRYLDTMAHIIQQETHGAIDKYIGDAIMAFWNAPEPVPDHARMACLAALRCRDAGRALALSPEWGGRPGFETRFGLHLDTALVGHFGAHDRMNYTAIGDAVNLGARLEGLNKQYGTTIIASEQIVKAAGDGFEFRLLDLVAVKGKSKAVRIYELLGTKGGAAARDEAIAAYEEAFERYLARDFASAIDILKKHGADQPGAILIERCRDYLREPPPQDWSGIFVAQSK
jgi:adenylate cyclase